MTVEQVTFIEPADIVGVELKCPHCSMRLVISLEGEWGLDRGAPLCPNCREELYHSNSNEGSDFKHFVAGLMCGRNLAIAAKVRLELKAQAAKSSPTVQT